MACGRLAPAADRAPGRETGPGFQYRRQPGPDPPSRATTAARWWCSEWTNADCPFTRKHYEQRQHAKPQSLARDHGVVWLSVISSAPGKQGYVDGPAADQLTKTRHAVPTAVLLDPTGSVGRLYHAKTTPHMFVIDAKGDAAAIWAASTASPPLRSADIPKAEPYLKEAMLAVVDNQPVAHPVTRPYGCSVKY